MSQTTTFYNTLTPISITLDNLASGNARESAFVDNTGVKYLDAMLELAFALSAGTPTPGANIAIYLAASLTNVGGFWTDNATGANAAITLRNPTNLIQLATVYTPDLGALTYKTIVTSIAAAMGGGILAPFWSIVVQNNTGLALAASGHTAQYMGITALTQ